MELLKEYNPYLEYRDGELFIEGVSLKELAQTFGTPLYVYSSNFIKERFEAYRKAFPDALICYAVKANFNPHLVKLLGELGAGADIVSGGELYLAKKAGIPPERIVYAGVGKTEKELTDAVDSEILMFNVESRQELDVLNEIAGKLGKKARIAIRVNPDVDPKTHPYIATGMQKSKFGVDIREAQKEYEYASKLENLEIVGIHCHIGSQILDISPYREAVEKVVSLYESLTQKGFDIKYLDIGGGLGIKYKPEDKEPAPQDLADLLKDLLENVKAKIILEPGRSIMGNAGILITQVQFLKDKGSKHFIIVDAGMNDLIRPSIYNAYHHIIPVETKERKKVVADIVGPICETGDFLALDREIEEVQRGEYLAVLSAGAYGFAMSSHYNMRPRAAEVLVENGSVKLIRKRENYDYIVEPSLDI
ncbi:diaminopimelate decarboxylase [Aquifex aeolicus]|uniref:Diaminopimelate decarboxylase n=1 Tax=Aquifex aeolicus (strain VF5) TaxID=224324 RepID=DCDA_AQUAE|nr:diaminopimelate decarboxylase [Aquifex aeolicus]O67262.1 RecName: Full=Diaminopimelate decarboxylase; Short=DAP decarboxylase; Short=DAPDC [Aquifex aeolicus VF5]AAC07209.1 diaminopimelate decarboxylase [Aquifex aeolicus VF5]2P3E_A Chain A, Diaminopimelate decarboxylase [Aquifex aeolicus VF5]2P3E_B Chain B, Diaminopimelate decarboxylase [Aquifex aeolicus VF5]